MATNANIVTLNIQGQVQVLQSLGATQKSITKLVKSAIRTVTTDYRKAVAKQSAAAYDIKPAGFTKIRARRKIAKGQILKGNVWLGTNQIASRFLKKHPKQTAAGVKIGNYFFPGAFIRIMPNSGKRLIMQRVPGTNKVKEVKIDIPQADQIAAQKIAALPPILENLLAQKINAEIQRLMS